mgnify:CR=1 FL=1
MTYPLVDEVVLESEVRVGRELHGWHCHAVADGHSLEVDAGPLTQLRCLVDTVGNCGAVVTLSGLFGGGGGEGRDRNKEQYS